MDVTYKKPINTEAVKNFARQLRKLIVTDSVNTSILNKAAAENIISAAAFIK